MPDAYPFTRVLLLPRLQAPCWVTLMENTVTAGFPAPTGDGIGKCIDLNEQLILHPQATYLMRARGDAMSDAGIFDGDTLIVDRAIKPRHGHIVVAVVEGELVCKKLVMQGRARLKSANPGYPDIPLRTDIDIWGVVAHVVRTLNH